MPQHGDADVRKLQEELNYFSEHFLEGLDPLDVDGVIGPLTHRRIRVAKYQLGYEKLTDEWTEEQRKRLRHPKEPGLAPDAVIERGNDRRVEQRKKHDDNTRAGAARAGVVTFDGKPCAKWMVPYLEWAREHGGWKGRLESGFRDPEYSEHLCYQRCGAPSCPGTCAGRSSNHCGDEAPHGAIDVTQYVQFAEAMKRCPLKPKIYNDLPNDRVHFSATGR